MSLPRYPLYEESGIPWVGEVPAHWRVLPLIGVANERSEPNLGMKEDNLLSLSYGRIVQKDIDSNDGLLPASFETYQVVRAGDIVLRLTDLQNDKRSLRSALVSEQGIITSAYVALNPKGVDSSYLAYLLRAYDLSKVFYSMGGGLRQSMKFSDMKRLPVVLPPRDEQAVIASFLDRETAKIDGLIGEQERFLDLLVEKRMAIISDAVTRGLNAMAPIKDTGLQWLGGVPAHWEAGRLKRFADVLDCKHHTVQFLDDGLPIVSIRELRENRIDISNAKLTSPKEWEYLREDRAPVHGDLVFCRNASVGAVGYVDDDTPPFCMGQDVCLIRPAVRCRYMYYHLMATSVACQIETLLVGATIRRLNVEEIRNLTVAFPNEAEQRSIAAYLDDETAKLDALKADADRAMTLLRERRSGLITAAVTGKIDVRGGPTSACSH